MMDDPSRTAVRHIAHSCVAPVYSPKEIGINLGAFNSGEDFVLDDSEHILLHSSEHSPEAEFRIAGVGSIWEMGG